MRDLYAETDLVSAEVQSFYADGAVALHTRSLKYGRLDRGQLVRVPPMLALQSEEFQSSPLLKQDQAPLPPAYAFSGTVKRSEWYNNVSPAFVERAVMAPT